MKFNWVWRNSVCTEICALWQYRIKCAVLYSYSYYIANSVADWLPVNRRACACMQYTMTCIILRLPCVSVRLSVTGGHRKLPWPRNLGGYIQAQRSLDTSGIAWPRALGLLLPTVALSTFVNMRGVCKLGSWSSIWRLTVSDRKVNMRKTLLW